MSKKIIMACMALVALAAFALPAAASAANKPTLVETPTSTETIDVVVGEKIIATNSGDTIFWSTNKTVKQVTCTSATLTGTVVANANGTVEGNITSAKFSGSGEKSKDNELPECTGSFGNAFITVKTPMCIRSTPTSPEDGFRVTGNECGKAEAPVTFTIGSTTAGECKYEATPTAVTGTFTTNETETTFAVSETNTGSGAEHESTNGFLCPTSGQLQMTFHLWTDTSEGKEGTKIGMAHLP